ncbi:MAG: hypothetical protein EOO60_08775 [Hymenobacter sp.]|nr:MAG: hypothetical protein EOO60_08775 [Hymenobacter sp.]
MQAEHDAVADVEYEAPTNPDYDEVAQLVQEVEVANPDYDEVPLVNAVPERAEPVVLASPVADFAFELGRDVLPVTQAQSRMVVWRGVLKERHPATGLLHRVPVYWLDDGYWDCYREEELQLPR